MVLCRNNSRLRKQCYILTNEIHQKCLQSLQKWYQTMLLKPTLILFKINMGIWITFFLILYWIFMLNNCKILNKIPLTAKLSREMKDTPNKYWCYYRSSTKWHLVALDLDLETMFISEKCRWNLSKYTFYNFLFVNKNCFYIISM